MTKTVRLTEILVYLDGIVTFKAADTGGDGYICDLIGTVDGFNRYLVVTAAQDRLEEFERGRLDLRTLLLEGQGEHPEWYITTALGRIGEPLEIQPQSTPLIESGYLVYEGYFLDLEPLPGDE